MIGVFVMVSDEIRDFLNDPEIQNLINQNKFQEVYAQAGWDTVYKLTEVFWNCNIHPEFYMTEIPEYFSRRSITNFDIPDNIKSIGNEAFFGCERLTNITIPDSVKSIGTQAF